MRKPHIRDIYKSPESIKEIILDLEFQQRGGRLYFVVDPSEVIDFCFPLNPRDHKQNDLREIADNQIALYDVLFARSPKPILLEPYADEMQRYSAYLAGTVTDYGEKAEILLAFTRNVDLDEYRGIKKDKLLDNIGRDFNMLLAFAMGIYSFGADRFKQASDRLVRIPQGLRALRPLAGSYKETPLVRQIYYHLRKQIEELFERRAQQKQLTDRDEIEKHRRIAASLVDARAVDTLIYLNKELSEAHQAGKTEQQVFLYLSSASRTETIFKFLKESVPQSLKNIYPFWRTKAQVFAHVVHRVTTADGNEDLAATLRNLANFRDAATEIHKLDTLFSEKGDECSRCVIEGGPGDDCELRELCESVKKLDQSIQKRSAMIQNLGLAAGMSKYEAFLKAVPSGQDNPSLDPMLKKFREICDTAQIGDLALHKMQSLQAFSLAQTRFTSMVSGLAVGDRGPLGGPDIVTSVVQKFPVNPNLTSDAYRKIADLIVEYYEAVGTDKHKRDFILEAYREFLAIDASLKNPVGEHEFVRCLIYLAFPGSEGAQRAFDHARSSRATFKESVPEFNYVMIWAARLLKRFKEADQVVKESLAAFPEDPRFQHGRTLVIFSWLSDAEQRQDCPYTLGDSIEAAYKAIELYRKMGTRFVDAIGGCLDDLAYLLSYRWDDPAFNLTEARRVLVELKECIKKDEWALRYPEYLHTEANLEYQEFLRDFPKATDREGRERLKRKLTSARKDIRAAIKLLPKKIYRELESNIEMALSRLNSK